ncbi:selenium-binding family protein [Sphingomonas sp. NSE70-1]|uniref:Selenium-binding family protein n=1 Tax=Sphingomonas caseinilyticus TaxID=2908205 RepID=A0ABT0RWU8_9SPHN|nr:selenium-binding family protein [Sphingomonas caseinilyticus]MCL6699507.1 selenium-binding family protein [Sphingomonas caseinilyticus]
MFRGLQLFVLALLTWGAAAQSQSIKAADRYLFVWVGDPAKTGNDFLVVVDADPASPTYGKLVTGIGTDQKSSKAHHSEYEMPASGMLFANDHDANRTLIMDLRNPRQPRQAGAFTSLGGYSMPHSFVRLPNGNVLATFQYPDHGGHMAMGGKTGGLVEIDDSGKMVRSASNADPAFADEGLLPYGLAVLPKIDRVIVTNSPMRDDFLLTSNTYQLFRLSDLKLLGTHRLDPGPRLNGHISPEEPRIGADGVAYVHTLSCGVQRVTGMEGPAPKAKLVYQYPGSWCGVPTIVGQYMVQSVPDIHGFIVLDITDGDRPVEVSRLVMGSDFAPHWTAWDPKSRRLAVTPEKPGQRMYLLKLDEKSGALTIDEAFRGPDGQAGFSFAKQSWPHGWTGEGAPHGAVFSR